MAVILNNLVISYNKPINKNNMKKLINNNCLVFCLIMCIVSVFLTTVVESAAGVDSNSCASVKVRFAKRGFAVSEFPVDPIEGKFFFPICIPFVYFVYINYKM